MKPDPRLLATNTRATTCVQCFHGGFLRTGSSRGECFSCVWFRCNINAVFPTPLLLRVFGLELSPSNLGKRLDCSTDHTGSYTCLPRSATLRNSRQTCRSTAMCISNLNLIFSLCKAAGNWVGGGYSVIAADAGEDDASCSGSGFFANWQKLEPSSLTITTSSRGYFQ